MPSSPKPEAQRPTARGAASVTVGILLSRLVGLARQRVVAHYFGTSEAADALAAAFRLGNITQNLLGEGTLSATFIPVYARLRGKDPESARRFARAALGLLLPVVISASVLGAVGAPIVTKVLVSGFTGERLDTAVRVTRVVFPMTGLLVIAAWSLGVLNAHRKFFLSYAAPVVWSIAQIVALLVGSFGLGLHGADLAVVVGVGGLVGAVLQVALMLAPTHRVLGSLAPIFDRTTDGIAEATRRLPGAILGRGIIQLSGLVDTALVSYLGPGANSIFAYAQTIYLLPMSVLGTGEAAAALPELAEQNLTADPAVRFIAMRAELGRSLSRLITLSFMATAVFVFLGGELITVLLQGGSFNHSSTRDVAVVLGAYSLGLPANAVCRLLTTTCFALGDTGRPALYAIVRVAVSTGISIALMGSLGVSGVVLGAGTAAWAELLLLGYVVRKEIGGLGLEVVPFFKIGLACAVSIGVGIGLRHALPAHFNEKLPGALLVLAAAGIVFLLLAVRLRILSLRGLLRG